MALKTPTSPLIIAATQGSADAFAQGSCATGLTGRLAYNLKGIAFEFTAKRNFVNQSRLQLRLTRRSKAALPNISDTDVIWAWDEVAAYVTSGGAFGVQCGYFTFPLDMPIVEEFLYLQIDSDLTAVSNGVIVRLDVEQDTISDVDRLNLIARSLQ